MIEIGSTIEAVVERIEHYGVYLRHGEDTVLVLVPEVSWNPAQDLMEQFHVGDRRPVYITRYNYRDGIHVGSLRRVYSVENPYRKLSRLPRGTILHGKVGSILGPSVQVHLSRYVTGYLHRTAQAERLLSGESVDVTISSLEVEEGNLILQLVTASHSQMLPASHLAAPVAIR